MSFNKRESIMSELNSLLQLDLESIYLRLDPKTIRPYQPNHAKQTEPSRIVTPQFLEHERPLQNHVGNRVMNFKLLMSVFSILNFEVGIYLIELVFTLSIQMIIYHHEVNSHYLIIGNKILQPATLILRQEGSYLKMISMSSHRYLICCCLCPAVSILIGDCTFLCSCLIMIAFSVHLEYTRCCTKLIIVCLEKSCLRYGIELFHDFVVIAAYYHIGDIETKEHQQIDAYVASNIKTKCYNSSNYKQYRCEKWFDVS